MEYRSSGFTLIELVLVISLLIISVGVSTDIIVTLIRSYNKTQVTTEIEQTANFVLLKMEKDIRKADSVEVSGGGATLTLTYEDGSTNAYSVSGGLVTLNSIPVTDNTFAGGGVNVTCGTSNCFRLVGPSIPQVVQLDIDFRQAGTVTETSYTGVVNLDNTVVVRGTY